MIMNFIKGILKFIFIAFGLLCILAAIGDDSGDRTTFIIVAVISLIIGASIETKKKEQPQSAQQSRRTQPVALSQADRRRIEDRKRLLLNEMQMCQQRINECYMENKIEAKSKDTDVFSLFSMGSNLYALKKDQEYLNKLREEYDELSNL